MLEKFMNQEEMQVVANEIVNVAYQEKIDVTSLLAVELKNESIDSQNFTYLYAKTSADKAVDLIVDDKSQFKPAVALLFQSLLSLPDSELAYAFDHFKTALLEKAPEFKNPENNGLNNAVKTIMLEVFKNPEEYIDSLKTTPPKLKI